MKIFVHFANAYFERRLCKLLKSNHKLIGTVTDDDGYEYGKVNYLDEVITNTTESIKKAILECDIIIYRLKHGLEEARFSIKVLEGSSYDDPKLFCLISSMQSWAKTKKRYTEGEGGEGGGEGEEGEDEDDDEKKNREYEAFVIDQIVTRKPNKKYMEYVEVEKRVRRAKRKMLTPLVIYPGVLYGEGEDMLHGLFKQAWEGKEESLYMCEDNKNFIPMIHVNDLARITKNLIEHPPEDTHYFFAVDDAQVTQKDLIQCLTKEFLCKKPIVLEEMEYVLKYEGNDYLIMDLKCTSSIEDTEGSETGWVSKEGLIKNIKKIRKEFEEERVLSPLKISLFGKPGIGKTHFAKLISNEYKIPHILISDLIKEYFEQEKEMQELVTKLTPPKKEKKKKVEKAEGEEEEEEEEKAEEEEEQQPEESEELKAAKKKLKDLLDLKNKVDDKGRYPDETLALVYKWKLSLRTCKNHGWVVDGFPKNLNQANLLLKNVDKVEEEGGDEEGEEGEEGEKEKVDSTVLPDFILSFNSKDELIENRIMKISKDDKDRDRFKRRLETFKENNKEDESGILAAFEEQIVKGENARQSITKEINIESEDVKEADIFDQIKKFIGNPHNYGPTEEEIELDNKKKKEKEDEKKKRIELEKKKNLEKIENEKQQREKLLAEYEKKLKDIEKNEREMLKTRSEPLRQYLLDNVLPTLTKGLVEVCEVKPEDPVDYLANFLFREAGRK